MRSRPHRRRRRRHHPRRRAPAVIEGMVTETIIAKGGDASHLVRKHQTTDVRLESGLRDCRHHRGYARLVCTVRCLRNNEKRCLVRRGWLDCTRGARRCRARSAVGRCTNGGVLGRQTGVHEFRSDAFRERRKLGELAVVVDTIRLGRPVDLTGEFEELVEVNI